MLSRVPAHEAREQLRAGTTRSHVRTHTITSEAPLSQGTPRPRNRTPDRRGRRQGAASFAAPTFHQTRSSSHVECVSIDEHTKVLHETPGLLGSGAIPVPADDADDFNLIL